MTKMTEEAINEHLGKLSGWTREGDAIQKTFKLPSFPGAIAFVTHVAFLAEAAAHHPDIDIRYNKVKMSLSTHSAGGLTEKDFHLAAEMDEFMA
jgi:4a-hydroxytetrahydrobiopterin dehydratase